MATGNVASARGAGAWPGGMSRGRDRGSEGISRFPGPCGKIRPGRELVRRPQRIRLSPSTPERLSREGCVWTLSASNRRRRYRAGGGGARGTARRSPPPCRAFPRRDPRRRDAASGGPGTPPPRGHGRAATPAPAGFPRRHPLSEKDTDHDCFQTSCRRAAVGGPPSDAGRQCHRPVGRRHAALAGYRQLDRNRPAGGLGRREPPAGYRRAAGRRQALRRVRQRHAGRHRPADRRGWPMV